MSDLCDVIGETPARKLSGLSANDRTEISASCNLLKRATRWGCVYALFLPHVENKRSFNPDLPDAVFDKAMGYMTLFKSNYEQWQVARVQFEAIMKTIGGPACWRSF